MPTGPVIPNAERVSDDEFRFLPLQSAELGLQRPVPQCRRINLPHGISGLLWGDRPAKLVMLHGAALNAHTWDDTLLLLNHQHPAAGAPFLAIDLPGHGESAWLDHARYSPAILGPLVAEALVQAREMNLLDAGFGLVGQSLGGLTGIELADTSARPEQVVLVDILPLPVEAARQVASFLDGPRKFPSRSAIIERALAFGLGGSSAALERGVIHNTRLTPTGTVIWKHHLGQLGATGLPVIDPAAGWARLAESDLRIDLVLATNSIVDPGLVDRFGQVRPTAKVVRIPGGHNLQEDSPADLAKVLDDLLARYWGTD